MARIGIIGYGFVGKAVECGFKPLHRIFIHDNAIPSLTMEKVVDNADFIFVCVPTPMDSSYRKIDLSIVEEVVGQIINRSGNDKNSPLIIIKSTVIPGTTQNLANKFDSRNIVFNPEFLTEANYLNDFIHPDRIVIGADNQRSQDKLLSLYKKSFPNTRMFVTDSRTAEMVKYMCNTYLATKVIFANEIFDLCQVLKINYNEVKQMVVADHRIFDSHLEVTPQRGFGGKCFPKDIVALLGLAEELGVDLSLLKNVWEKNLKLRLFRDWEKIPGTVSKNR